MEKSTKIDNYGNSCIDVPITFRPKDFGSALWDIIIGKGTGHTMKGHINVDTPFRAMKFPISKEGATTILKMNKEDDANDDELVAQVVTIQQYNQINVWPLCELRW